MSPERARKILNLAPEAGLEEARAAFRQRVKQVHPDRAGARVRGAYEDVVAAWRALEAENRPADAPAKRVEPETVEVQAQVSWLSIRMGETIEVPAPHRTLRVPLPTDARAGERLRLRGSGGEPDVIVILQIAQRPLAEAIRRFVEDFRPPRAQA